MRPRAVAAVAVLAIALGACSEPLEFAAWTIPAAAGARIVEYGPVPIEERIAEIELVADLTVGGDPDDANQSFYNPSDIAVAADGRMFVLERGNHRIQAFSSTGEYSTTIGREGQGPGEIAQGGEIAVVEDRLVRSGDSKLSVWTLDGEHLGDSALPFRQSFAISRLSPGWVFGTRSEFNEDNTSAERFIRVSLQAETGMTFAEATLPRSLVTIVNESGMTIVRLPGPTPAFATTLDGMVYVTAADEYQVHAFDAEGRARWALRTAWERLSVNDVDIERAVLRRTGETPARNLDVEWPQLNPALASVAGTQGGPALLVDGHGHLYVFPFVREPIDGRYPVDVYAADGERLFAGLIRVTSWKDALKDFVYLFEARESDGEAVAVRYRLVEPFE